MQASSPVQLNAGHAGTFWLHLDSGPISSATIATEAARRSFIVLNAWDYAYIPQFKAVNPNVILLVYKDLSSSRTPSCQNGIDNAELPTGVGYCWANANHPEWFLTDNSGNRLQYDPFPGSWQMDIGNAGYQQTWARNVAADVTANHWDGVMMDNALVRCDTYHSGICPAKYASDSSFQDAYKAMLAVTHPALLAAGIHSIANMAGARIYPGVWNAYIDNLDGGFDEFWEVFSPGSHLPEYGHPSVGWKAQVDEISYAVAHGKFVGVQPHSDSTDTAGFFYALASYLLANDGRSSISEAPSGGYQDPPPWRSQYSWNLGQASGLYYQVSTNVYRRDFTCGTVAVNANQSGSDTVNFGRSYINESGNLVSSVTLNATSGTVLRTPKCTPATPAPHTVTSAITGIANKCLDNYQNRKADGNKIDLFTCNGTNAQRWTMNTSGSGAIVNVNGYCLNVQGAGTTSGTLVQLYQCNNTVAQQWTIDPRAGTIVNPHSGLCLEDQNSATTDGNQIWIAACNGTAAQRWITPL